MGERAVRFLPPIERRARRAARARAPDAARAWQTMWSACATWSTTRTPNPIPGRRTILLSSVVFCFASTLLLLQFVGLTLHTCSLDTINGLGAASCVCWLGAMSKRSPAWPRHGRSSGQQP